jgi:hypothetical protein
MRQAVHDRAQLPAIRGDFLSLNAVRERTS